MNNFKLEENFRVLETLGKGAFSVVYKVCRKKSNKIYALKKVPLKSLKKKEIQNSLNEIRILASIHNPNIIGYREAFIDKKSKELCIVMEYASGGDLSKKINTYKKKKKRIPENLIIRFFHQMTSALHELHIRSIIHRDLKTANIFITGDSKNIKLGDMNVSKVVKNLFAYTQTGTPYYASPEVWRDEPYNIKTDIWSLGCVLYEMCMLRPPFRSSDMDGLYEKVQKGEIEFFDDFYSNQLKDSICKLLIVHPNKRPTCEKILKFDIFKSVEGCFEKENKNNNVDIFAVDELIDTIKAGKTFFDIEKNLPKSKYQDFSFEDNGSETQFGFEEKSRMFKKKNYINKLKINKSKFFLKKKNKSLSKTKKKRKNKPSTNKKKNLKTFVKASNKKLKLKKKLKSKSKSRKKTNKNNVEKLKKKIILKKINNKKRLKSAADLTKKSKSSKYRIKSSKIKQQLIINSKKKNKKRVQSTKTKSKKIPIKNLINLKLKLNKHSEYLNKLLRNEKSKSKLIKIKKKYLPSIKSTMNPSINILPKKINKDKNLSAMWKLSNLKSIELQNSLKSFGPYKNKKFLKILKNSNLIGIRPLSVIKHKSPTIIKKYRIKSSKNKFLGKKILKNYSNIDKKNSNVFVNFSINQNMCMNIKDKNGKMNIDSFLDFLKINKKKN